MLNGIRIIESAYLTEPGEPYEVRRTLRERLFSRPWHPFQRTRMVTPQVPMKGGYQLADGTLIMHPETLQRLKRSLGEILGISQGQMKGDKCNSGRSPSRSRRCRSAR